MTCCGGIEPTLGKWVPVVDDTANPTAPPTSDADRTSDDVVVSMPATLPRLTDRELEVLRYLPTRLSNGEIAGSLSISQNTVKTHLKEIYRKLHVGCRNEAIVVATEQSLLPPESAGALAP